MSPNSDSGELSSNALRRELAVELMRRVPWGTLRFFLIAAAFAMIADGYAAIFNIFMRLM